ncbi:crossover junction endodeoxyribonuclease RuvC [Candidatus Saganbacteria bacterium]|uniref:Crossover junction endodeoxyribonuclease RuvC n=1 Tax=Candidatus Saganbacteria bacterium TaxID=2575572 RepID=A0A9D6UN61_UNCSA|nr:crossover junction endodeoxyribonuclease RuvC [Candidatus Saganbacteria bacterium]
MLTLGIDPGTAATGFGLVRQCGDRLLQVGHGCILTSPAEAAHERLAKIYSGLKKLIDDYKPDMVAVERLYFGSNSKTALAVGQARGMVLLAAAERKIPISEYTPLEVKIAITGYGKAGKKQIQQMVKNLLNLSQFPKPDDAADALAVAICHLHSYKMLNFRIEAGGPSLAHLRRDFTAGQKNIHGARA